MASLCHIIKDKILTENYRKLQRENYFKILLSLQRIKHNLCWKIKILKQATYITYIRYVIGKPSKSVQISTLTSSDSFLQRIPGKLKSTLN